MGETVAVVNEVPEESCDLVPSHACKENTSDEEPPKLSLLENFLPPPDFFPETVRSKKSKANENNNHHDNSLFPLNKEDDFHFRENLKQSTKSASVKERIFPRNDVNTI